MPHSLKEKIGINSRWFAWKAMWLMKGLTPCYKTIAYFRKENVAAFRESFRQFTCFLRTEGLFCEDRVATEVPSLARVKLEKEQLS